MTLAHFESSSSQLNSERTPTTPGTFATTPELSVENGEVTLRGRVRRRTVAIRKVVVECRGKLDLVADFPSDL